MDASSTRAYIELLEKTNQQLGLWSNPYGILTGILGFLVAVLAIVVAYTLWRQGHEYRAAFNEFLASQKKIAEDALAQERERIQEELNRIIAANTETLESLTGDARARIEKQIEALRILETEVNKPAVRYPFAISAASVLRPSVVGGYDPTASISLSRFYGQTAEQIEVEDLKKQVSALLNQVQQLQSQVGGANGKG